MTVRRDVFQAIADPTRHAIIDKLAGQTLSLQEIADGFKISQPAVSKQMKILQECGLVRVTRSGRESHCMADLAALEEVIHWAERYRRFWSDRLNMLEDLIHKEQKKKKTKKTKKSTVK